MRIDLLVATAAIGCAVTGVGIAAGSGIAHAAPPCPPGGPHGAPWGDNLPPWGWSAPLPT
jgi:hypothetical protein